jgi:hypothetical protein
MLDQLLNKHLQLWAHAKSGLECAFPECPESLAGLFWLLERP